MSEAPSAIGLLVEQPPRWNDRRVGLMLGALVCVLFALLVAIFSVVVSNGWQSFAHNGLAWFGWGGSVDAQIERIYTSGDLATTPVWTFHAWPLIWSTTLIVGGAIALSLVVSLFTAVFIVEFAPSWMKAWLAPVMRFLASVPSVIYGLLGVVLLVPFINDHLIAQSARESVAYTITLTGYSLLAGVIVLTVMISPLMTAMFADGLRAVPRIWLEGALAVGINPWRTTWKIGVRTARPAIVAGTVLAAARGIGEAVMLAMVSGAIGFGPNPFDGWIFFVEPTRPLASTIITNADQMTSVQMTSTLFAIATVLLFSAAALSFAGWVAKQPMRKYGVRT